MVGAVGAVTVAPAASTIGLTAVPPLVSKVIVYVTVVEVHFAYKVNVPDPDSNAAKDQDVVNAGSVYHPSNVKPSLTGVGNSTEVLVESIVIFSISLPPSVSKLMTMLVAPVHAAIDKVKNKNARIITTFRIIFFSS